MLVARVVDSSSATAAFAAGVVFVGVLLAVAANDTACVSRHPMHKEWRGNLVAYMSSTPELPGWQPPQYVDLRLLFAVRAVKTRNTTVGRPPRCETAKTVGTPDERSCFLVLACPTPTTVCRGDDL